MWAPLLKKVYVSLMPLFDYTGSFVLFMRTSAILLSATIPHDEVAPDMRISDRSARRSMRLVQARYMSPTAHISKEQDSPFEQSLRSKRRSTTAIPYAARTA